MNWSQATQELKLLLNEPLPGGFGFMMQRDRKIQRLCKLIAKMELPKRGK